MMTQSIYTTLFLMFLVLSVSSVDDNCPYQKCDCYSNTIHCGFNEFKKLPPLRSVNITRPLALVLTGNSLTTIPAGALPSMLTSIDFQDNPLKTIDKDAFNGSADTLTKLSFGNLLFTEIPDALLRLNNLTQLIISDMKITTWDDNVMKHVGTTLQTLSLTNVDINSWPPWFQYLSHLGTLNLRFTSLLIPDNGLDNQINTLFSLSLENCNLTEIPSVVTKLIHLQTLELDDNNLSKINGIPNSPVLSSINLANNKISDAAQLSQALLAVAASLTNLQLSRNQLTYFPDLSAMAKLQNLYIAYNSISYTGTSKIPPSLIYLDLDGNNLQSIDSFMRSGLGLIHLIIQHSSIKEILGVDIPVSVQEMDISNNLLTELTDESFPSNSNMQTLTLDFNPIAKISTKAFANLSKLTVLTMGSSKITRLPLSFTYLTSATTIDLGESQDLICTCEEKDVRSLLQLHQNVILGTCGVTTIAYFLLVMSEQCPD